MRRRRFLTLMLSGGLAAAAPTAFRAQEAGRKRVGVLDPHTPDDPTRLTLYAALEEGLAKLGWVKDRNFAYDRIWLRGDLSLAPAAAREIVGRRPDVIFVIGGGPTAAVAAATKSIPVVFHAVNDPVGQGLAQSLARPGGNLTGVAIFDPPVIGKWVELLLEVAPHLKRVVFWGNPLDANSPFLTSWLEGQSRRFKVPVTAVASNTMTEVEALFARLGAERDAGVVLVGGAFEAANRQAIVDLTVRYSVPTMSQGVQNVELGGLIAYAFDATEPWAAAAGAIDQTLRGVDPSVIPIILPQSYKLAINARTARLFGLRVSSALFAAADVVIE